MAKKLTSNKAKKILHDKSVHGKPLTDKQRRFFGAIAGGAKPYKAESGGWLDKYDKAQVGIEVPEYALRHMTGDIQSRGPNLAHKARMDEAVQRAKEKRDQEARTRTTISADTRSEAQRKKDAQAAAARRKYEEEVLGNDLSRPSAEKARNKEEAERIIHNLVDVPMTLMGAGELAYLGGRGLMKTVPNVTKSLIVQSPSTTKSNLNNIITEKLKEQYPSWFIKESAKTKATDELSKIEAENFLKSFLQDPDKQALYTPVNLKIPAYGQTNLGLNPHLEGGRQFRVVDEGSGIFRKRADKLEDGFNMYDLLQSTQYHLRKNKFGGIVKAQNGIEGTMGGLTDKGFNYNGAWGGTMQDGGNLMPAMAGANQTVPMAQLGDSVKPIPMQLAMGGSLPGSVGFTYARTIDPAPSNGPYAKKTKASAQNGMEMKYYQEGLDFKPKTISKNGGWLDKYDKAQAGEEIPAYLLGPMRGDIQSRGPNLANKARMDEAVREAREKREQDAERQKAIDQRNKEKARDYQEAINKSKSKPLTQASAKDIREQEYNRKYKASKESEARRVAKEEQLAKEKERAMIAEGKAAEATRENSNVPFTFPTGETKLWKDMDWREKQYVAGRNLGSMSRFNNWTDWINPVTYIGEMAEGLSTAPYVARETDSNIPYAIGVGAPLLAGALGGGKSARQFLSNVANPVPVPASNIGRGFSKLMDLPSYLPLRLETGAKSFLMGSILGGAEGTLGLLSRLVGKPAKTRSFQEIFPMSQTAKLAAQKESKQAVAEGNQFVKDWAYDESGFARPDVTSKVENILTGEGSPINPSVRFENNWEVLNQSPLNYVPSKSVNTRFSNILNNPYLTPEERGRILRYRASAYGVNYADDTTVPASYTFENVGPYNFPYKDKLFTTVHEDAHTLQEFGATQFIPASPGNLGSLKTTTVGQMLAKLYPEHKYWSPNLETSIGKKFAEAMVPPKKGKRVWEASPVELHSELMAARLKLVKDYQEKGMGYQEAINVVKNETDRQLDEMIKMQKLNRFFKKGVSQEKKRELLRLLPAAVPVVGAASVLAQDQPPQQRDGGEIVVDPMGYWNPENVGNPVIIPSNVITMEGVDQPLIGISDTGDIQYMEPGEDYEFEGESVLEMPVAQDGKKMPIRVDSPTDPRLIRYEDSVALRRDFLKNKALLDAVTAPYGIKPAVSTPHLRPRTPDGYYRPLKMVSKEETGPQYGRAVIEGNKVTLPQTGTITYPEYEYLTSTNIYPVKVHSYNENRVLFGSAPSWKGDVFEVRKNTLEDMEDYFNDVEEQKKYLKKYPYTIIPNKFNIERELYEYPEPDQSVMYAVPGYERKPISMMKPELTAKPMSDVKRLPTEPAKKAPAAKKDKPEREKKTPIKDMLQELKWRREQNKMDRQIRKGQKRQLKCWSGVCYDDDGNIVKAKDGVSVNNADAQPLKKLDQLLNFTNYNKPTRGGWLDRYEN